MTGVIVPLRTTSGTTLTEFLEDKPYRSSVNITPIAAYEISKAPVAVTVESTNLAAIEEIYEWATENLPTSAPLDIINRLKLAYMSGIRTGRNGKEEIVKSRSVFMDADLPNGAVGVQFSTPVAGGVEFTHWGLFIHGYGEVFSEVNGMFSQPYWSEILSSVIFAAVKDVCMGLHSGLICKVHEDTYGGGWVYDFGDRELMQAIKESRTPKPYHLTAESATDIIFWHRVGENLSGASLVTRIRQGKISALPPDQFEVKAVKDAETGTYTVWVRRSIGSRALKVADSGDAAEAAWERFSATMKEAFMKEFRTSHDLDPEQAA